MSTDFALSHDEAMLLDRVIAHRVAVWEDVARIWGRKADADYALGVAFGLRSAIDFVRRIAEGDLTVMPITLSPAFGGSLPDDEHVRRANEIIHRLTSVASAAFAIFTDGTDLIADTLLEIADKLDTQEWPESVTPSVLAAVARALVAAGCTPEVRKSVKGGCDDGHD
jgi:hypothetical protein